MLTRIKYISVAVADLDQGVQEFTAMLGIIPLGPPMDMPYGFRQVSLGNERDRQIIMNRIRPVNDASAVARFLNEGKVLPNNPDGEGIYLVFMETDNLEDSILRVQDNDGRIIQPPPNATGFAWIHPMSVHSVFIELQAARAAE